MTGPITEKPNAKQLLPTKKGLIISGTTVFLGPLVPFFWNMHYPANPMSAEVAAGAAGGVSFAIGMAYHVVIFLKNVLVAILKKYGINPEEGDE